MRRKILAANWKMNLTHEEVAPYLDRFLTEVGELTEVEVILIPSFTSIPALAYAFKKSPTFVELGAQNVHWEKGGAFTGEVSVATLRALQVKYVVIGHSERRQWFGETDEVVGKKVGATLKVGLHPSSLRGRDVTRTGRESSGGNLRAPTPKGARGMLASGP